MQIDKNYKPELKISIVNEKNKIKIIISDNGPGMDEKIKNKIFEPFFTTKKPGFGTGLGLSISYFIITDNHNGTLSVESKQGIGTDFIIKLPIGKSNEKK